MDLRTGITCPQCGLTSWHPKDVSEGYCANCHDWTHGMIVHTSAPVDLFRTEPIVASE